MATYYVKNGGNDGLDGLSDANAWATLSKVNGFAFNAGDIVQFKRGSTWTGLLNITRSGSSGSLITYTAYSTGNDPIIQNVGDYADCININANYIAIDHFKFQTATEYGIDTWSGGGSYITVSYCEFYDCGSGLRFRNVNNSIVEHCYFHDLKMIHNDVGGDDDYGANAIVFGENVTYTYVRYNQAIHCKAVSYDYGYDGGFVEFFGYNISNNHFYGNWIEDCQGAFECGSNNATHEQTNNQIHHNIFVNNKTAFMIHSTTSGFACNFHDNYAYNNTIYETIGNGAWVIEYVAGTFSANTLYFRNNIVWMDTTGGGTWQRVFSDHGLTHEYNHYNTVGFASGISPLGTGEYDDTDPLWVDKANDDFHLTGSSPCLNNAYDAGYTSDYEQSLVPQGSGPDRGALEYDEATVKWGASAVTGTAACSATGTIAGSGTVFWGAAALTCPSICTAKPSKHVTITIDDSSGDWYQACNGTTGSAAHEGTGGTTPYTGVDRVNAGMTATSSTWTCRRFFLKFNTSAIPDNATVVQAQMGFVLVNNPTITYKDFYLRLKEFNWSAHDPFNSSYLAWYWSGVHTETDIGGLWGPQTGRVAGTRYWSDNLNTAWISKTGYTYYGAITDLDDTHDFVTANTGSALHDGPHSGECTHGYKPQLLITYIEFAADPPHETLWGAAAATGSTTCVAVATLETGGNIRWGAAVLNATGNAYASGEGGSELPPAEYLLHYDPPSTHTLAHYEVWVLNDNYTKRAMIPRYINLTYKQCLDGVGFANVEVDPTCPQIPDLEIMKRLLIQRNGEIVFLGVILYEHFKIPQTAPAAESWSIAARDCGCYFDWRVTVPPPGDEYDKRGPDHADDVLKSYVRAHCGESAVAERRFDDLVTTADLHVGPSLTYEARNIILTTVLKNICLQSGVHWRMMPNSTVTGVEFRTYYPMYGVDRSRANGVNDECVFSLDRQNFSDISYIKDTLEHYNYIYVWGQGEGTERLHAEGEDAVARAFYKRRERYADARHVELEMSLEDEIPGYLKESEVVRAMSVAPHWWTWKNDWDLGDIVTIEIRHYGNTFSYDGLVMSVEVDVDRDGHEDITPELEGV